MTRGLPLGCVLVLLSSGCVLQQVTTEIRVRDATAATLRAADGRVVLPPDATESEAVLAEGRIATGVGDGAPYTVLARRERNHSMTLTWSSTYPFSSGDARVVGDGVLLRPDGVSEFPFEASTVVTPEMLKKPVLELHWCTSLESRRIPRSTESLHGITPRACVKQTEAPSSYVERVPYSLETPWSNVEVRGKVRPERSAAWLGIGFATPIFGGLAAWMASTPAAHFSGGNTSKWFLVGLSSAFMLGFDIPLLFTALAPDRDEVLRPRAE